MKKRAAPPTHRWDQIQHWVKTHPRKSAAIAIAVILVVGGVIYALTQPKDSPVAILPQPTKPKPAPVYYSPLTGVKVADEATTKRPVTAIMIENSPDARPHSGLKDAGIVYEAIAEAGITRFLTLYQESRPELIGPVRSLRAYYLDWAAAYDACIAHIGGSAAALAEVRNGNYCDTDQFFNSQYYWRATDRYAPHNVYTNFDNMDKVNAEKGKTTSNFTGFARRDVKPAKEPNANSVTINFSSPQFNTHYTYDAASNTYHRQIGGEPSLDREKGQLTPSVVVAMRVDMTHVMEDGWRESITTVGSGAATIFQGGIATEVTWRKASREAPLEFVNAEGKPVKLGRGQTWIAAVPNSGGTVSWQP